MSEITVKAGKDTINVSATKDMSAYYSSVSKNWAVKTDGTVDGAEYSAKYYAEEAKQTALSTLEDFENKKNECLAEIETEGENYVQQAQVQAEIAAEKASEATTTLEHSANTDLSNLTHEGKGVIRTLGAENAYTPPLFQPFWLPFEADNPPLVPANYSWLSIGYTSAYELLVSENKAGEEQTENIRTGYNADGTQISAAVTYRKSPKGFKIVDTSQIEVIDEIFNAAGIAWYFVLDEENQRFKLPRNTKYIKSTNDIQNAGSINYEGLPNITGFIHGPSGINTNGCMKIIEEGSKIAGGSSSALREGMMGFDASLSNSVYGASENVEVEAVNMMLYFWLGNNHISENKITGEVLENINTKSDLDLANALPCNNFKIMSVGWGMPDYSKGIAIAPSAEITAISDGIVLGKFHGNYESSAKVNNIPLPIGSGGNSNVWTPFSFFVSKGDVYMCYGAYLEAYYYAIPADL